MTKKLSRDIGTIQYEDEISNMRKSKRITECDKKTITYNIKIIPYENKTFKCEKNVT